MRCVIAAIVFAFSTGSVNAPASALEGRYVEVAQFVASPAGRYVTSVERVASPAGRYITPSEDVARESAPAGRYVRAPYSLPALLDASLMPLGATIRA